jgi:hypothetical protein
VSDEIDPRMCGRTSAKCRLLVGRWLGTHVPIRLLMPLKQSGYLGRIDQIIPWPKRVATWVLSRSNARMGIRTRGAR